MEKYPITTQKQVRAAFWEYVAEYKPRGVTRKKITDYTGRGKMYNTDTRSEFVNFVDSLARNGQISSALAHRVTLGTGA